MAGLASYVFITGSSSTIFLILGLTAVVIAVLTFLISLMHIFDMSDTIESLRAMVGVIKRWGGAVLLLIGAWLIFWGVWILFASNMSPA